MTKAFFVAGLRTPFGRAFKGTYKDVRPDDLLIELIGGHRSKFSEIWDQPLEDIIVGCAYPEGEQGYNLGRMVAIGSGLDAPGMTINRLCASSLESAAVAAARVRSGFATRILVGGVESMSRIPRRGANFSESDQIKKTNSLAYIPNGDTAENVARDFLQIDRQKQEEFAGRSHELADTAYAAGHYASHIHTFLTDRDEFIRVPVDLAKMASLKPAFSDDGVVTAATSSPLTDGATCGWVVDEKGWHQSGCSTALEIIDACVAHVGPEVMGLGPVPATKKLLDRNGLNVNQIAAWEINEAFAIQVLACLEELNIPLEKVNNWGGALAVGHPLGASGLRLLITLHHRLDVEGKTNQFGIATLCVGGGQGMSVLVRLVQRRK